MSEQKIFKSHREESRKNYGRWLPETHSLGLEEINTGALLRLADAVEVISKNYNDLLSENQKLKKRVELLKNENAGLSNSIRAYKGQITKLNNKINILKPKL